LVIRFPEFLTMSSFSPAPLSPLRARLITGAVLAAFAFIGLLTAGVLPGSLR
jgi:hypothetical protein